MNGWLGWTTEEWGALGALVAAGGAVGTLVVAIVAALAAFRQVREARALRQEQAQPYVAVFMEPSAASVQIIDLVVRNFGMTAAHDVQLDISPNLERSVEGGGVEPVWLPPGLPTLVPGQAWRTMWDSSVHHLQSGLPDRHDARVSFRDSRGQALSASYQLDWGAFKGRRWTVTYGIHDAAKALREIDKTMKKWRESVAGGLAVYVRDGDEKDRREHEEREAWLRERTAATARAAEPAAGQPEDGLERTDDEVD